VKLIDLHFKLLSLLIFY